LDTPGVSWHRSGWLTIRIAQGQIYSSILNILPMEQLVQLPELSDQGRESIDEAVLQQYVEVGQAAVEVEPASTSRLVEVDLVQFRRAIYERGHVAERGPMGDIEAGMGHGEERRWP
jgi:hypothetical protein